MGNEELYDRIEAYLSEQMTPEDAEAFQKEIAKNPDLAAELALHQNVAEAVGEEEEIEDLDHKISLILEKGKSNNSKVTKQNQFKFHPYLRIAAAIVLLIIASVVAYFYWSTNRNSPHVLYAKFVDYPSSIYEAQNLRSEDTPVVQPEIVQLDALWQKADEWYQKGEYQEALIVLQQVKPLEVQVFQENSSHFYYYQGILQAKTKEYPAALVSFEQVEINYTEDAKWKRALILLRLGDRREEALSMIREISSSSTPRQADAMRLLERLQSSK